MVGNVLNQVKHPLWDFEGEYNAMKEKIQGSLLKDNQNIKYAPHMKFIHKLTFPFPSKRISTARIIFSKINTKNEFEISLVLYHTGIVMGVFSGELEAVYTLSSGPLLGVLERQSKGMNGSWAGSRPTAPTLVFPKLTHYKRGRAVIRHNHCNTHTTYMVQNWADVCCFFSYIWTNKTPNLFPIQSTTKQGKRAET